MEVILAGVISKYESGKLIISRAFDYREKM